MGFVGFVKRLISFILITLGFICLSYGIMSLEVITFNPRIYLITDFRVDNRSIHLDGFGYGLEYEGLSGLEDSSLHLDINRRFTWRIDFIYRYLSVNNCHLILYNYSTNFYEHLSQHSFSIKDYIDEIKELCNSLDGNLVVDIESPYSALITGFDGVLQIKELYLVRPATMFQLRIPIKSIHNEVVLLYDKSMYKNLSNFNLRVTDLHCKEDYCKIYANIVSSAYSPIISRVTYTPSRTIGNLKVAGQLLIATSALLIVIAILMQIKN